MRTCPHCGNDLRKTGLTTTRNEILECDGCAAEYVAEFDRLIPIVDHIDLFAAADDMPMPRRRACNE